MVELTNQSKHQHQAHVVEEESLVLLPSSCSSSPLDEKKESCSICKKKDVSFQGRVALYLVSSVFLVAHLVASLNYLEFKFNLYIQEFHQVIRSPWLLLVLGCECVYFLSSLISSMDYLIPPSIRPKPSKLRDFPTVDILLPCCKEPTEIPQESIMAALAMDYPHECFRVLVLDDGTDDDLKAFCHTLQVEGGRQQIVYLRRPKVQGVPHNFKCGNLNYGLEHSNAKYVVMMDADMILHSSFLQRLLPYIVDSANVAFVQVPQSFYNLPLGDPLNDSSLFFYNRTLVHRDTLSCVTCVGTGAIFRRKHLDDIGGFQPQSITEDTMTAFTLFNQGYRSVYLNENLQMGLTPWTLEGYIKQRQRWGQGAIQQFCSTWKTMLGRRSKLNFMLKILYFWHTGYYYLSIVNATLVVVLLSALAFQLNFSVGDIDDNRKLIAYLAIAILLWRFAWYSLWFGLPQPIQGRNREESHFWWMSPFFFKMVMESFFAYDKTFKFVPTSNIDRVAATPTGGKANGLTFLKQHLSQLNQVKIHLAYAIVVLTVVGFRVHLYVTRYSVHDCKETFYVVGLSFFLLTTCAHMLMPVISIVWPTNFQPSERAKLIMYDTKGVPGFIQEDCIPKWHPSIIFYEMLSYATLAFWSGLLWIAVSGVDKDWCQQGTLF